MKVKFERPPDLRGREQQQIQELHGYLFRLSEMLNVALDSTEIQSAGDSGGGERSPRAVFNSMKRLFLTSGELLDGYYDRICLRLQSVYLSLTDFRQFAADTAAQIEELRQGHAGDLSRVEEALAAQGEGLAQAMSMAEEGRILRGTQDGWSYKKWPSGDIELWGSCALPSADITLPLNFSSALAFVSCPWAVQAAVSGNVLSFSGETDRECSAAVFITGKETA